MTALKVANLGVRFLLELCLLVAFGYWGFQAGGNTLADFALGHRDRAAPRHDGLLATRRAPACGWGGWTLEREQATGMRPARATIASSAAGPAIVVIRA